MSNTILAAQLPPVMKPAPIQSGSHVPAGTTASRPQGGLFDQFLTQAEKDYLASQLQQVRWSR
ncbi:MAG: hypothetical protein HQL95_02700 [Magnetococcales bacterium]|nr:hypothetical protein [Magnetococcales bacterium]